MLRSRPQFSYNGLTVVLSNPSRFDKVSLLSAGGSKIFNSALQPEFNQWQCDIRVKEDKSPLLDNTKCLLFLGEGAIDTWIPETQENLLREIRGTPYLYNGTIPSICSWFPQDAADIKDYESEFNPQSDSTEIESDDDDDGADEKRHHGITKRKNFAFWLDKDIRKCKIILKNGGKIPQIHETPDYIIYPPAEQVIQLLSTTKNEYLYFDCETDDNLNIICFAFSFAKTRQVYVVPVQSYNYTWAYSSLCYIFLSLAIAIRDNVIVAHNGSAFDYFVLAYKYKIPINKVYDTMVALHRCYPSIEKSLGHGMSLFTWLPFHKDEAEGYYTMEQAKKMWLYCGKDVYGMKELHKSIEEHCNKRIGLRESIEQANRSIWPYLIATLQGIRYLQDRVDKLMETNDRLMTQYLRAIDILIGQTSMKLIKSQIKNAKGFPGSNPQCCIYFHDMLEYPVIFKSEKTGKPSLAKKCMFKLRLKQENPVIDLCIAYRELAKESGTLKFEPWIKN